MSSQRTILLLCILVWAGLFAASYFLSVRIEGPRNLDTGLQRLDVLARYQFMALLVAVLAATLGVVWRKTGRLMVLMGFAPLIATATIIAGTIAAALLFAGAPPEDTASPTPRLPATEAAPAQD